MGGISHVGIEVPPGETRHTRYEVGETYLGDPVEVPITVVNGSYDGPQLCLTAAVHGDELNGVKVCQEIARRTDPRDIHGTLVIVHVVNVPGYLAQQRYLPIYDLDLNRAFPGSGGNTAGRMARKLFEAVIRPSDYLLDFHTSTRGRTTMYHTRADLATPAVERLARAFGANVILSGAGDEGSLRKAATTAGTPCVTVEMGKAHRFQPVLVEKALDGVESVMAQLGMLPDQPVHWLGWWLAVDAAMGEKAWLRADRGGLVDMKWGPYPLVRAGEPICTVTDHFSREESVITAPFTGLIIGVLENPVAAPGHPLCHLVRVDEETSHEIEREIEHGEFDGYRMRPR